MLRRRPLLLITLLIALLWIVILSVLAALRQPSRTGADSTPIPLATSPATPPFSPSPLHPSPSPTAAQARNVSPVPVADPYDLSCRLKGLCGLSPFVPSDPFEVGAKRTFWVFDLDGYQAHAVQAILRHITPHAYFWLEEAIPYEPNALTTLAETFEEKIYPTNRALFGSEWNPGIDGDPHLYILFTRAISGVAGYFSSTDELSPQVHPYSNAHEMFVLNATALSLSSPATADILAHEFQHMIHWNMDRSESTWLNEGASMLAERVNGYEPGHFRSFLLQPDLNLTGWGETPSQSIAHYGQADLFLTYLYQRLGPQFIRELVSNPLDGLESVDDTLRRLPFASQSLSADQLFLDWAAALFLNDPSSESGRYASPAHEKPSSRRIATCPVESSDQVTPYGLDFITIACTGRYRLRFEGAPELQRFPVVAHSGHAMLWSNESNLSDTRLTHRFDLRQVPSPITLTYWTWYDLEENFDYAYLEASTDGKSWEILRTSSSTDRNPVGNAYGWGYSGKSGAWIQESVDLSRFAGQMLWLRFEYVTDDAITGQGLLLDDVSIPAIGYFSDFEQDEGGWETEGFQRVQDTVPVPFRLLWILEGTSPSVQEVTLSADNTAEFTFHLDAGQQATLVVTMLSRLTHQAAPYRFSITPLP